MKKMNVNAQKETNGGKTYKCEFCGKKFKFWILRNQHYLAELKAAYWEKI